MAMVYYNKTHRITFYTDISSINAESPSKDNWADSWEDWKLVPNPIPIFSEPDVKTSYADIPGMDGSLDMTENGRRSWPLYKNRQGTFDFILADTQIGWAEMKSRIEAFLHGRSLYAVLQDDKYYFYYGRFQVNDFKSDKTANKISISYFANPYKYERDPTDEKWLWDSFSFYTGIIRNNSLTYSPEHVKVTEAEAESMEDNASLTVYSSMLPVNPEWVVDIKDGYEEYGLECYYKLPWDNVYTIFYLENGVSSSSSVIFRDWYLKGQSILFPQNTAIEKIPSKTFYFAKPAAAPEGYEANVYLRYRGGRI